MLSSDLAVATRNINSGLSLNAFISSDTLWQPNISAVGQIVSGRELRLGQEGFDMT